MCACTIRIMRGRIFSDSFLSRAAAAAAALKILGGDDELAFIVAVAKRSPRPKSGVWRAQQQGQQTACLLRRLLQRRRPAEFQN